MGDTGRYGMAHLQIEVDDDGFVVARGDFSSPPGAGFWDRDRGSGS